jgi:hypothetical protein
MRLTVGPVVGVVTSTTIRLLIEVDETTPLKCVVIDEKREAFEFLVYCEANKPTTFTVANLKPNTPYSINFEGIENFAHRKAVIRTFHDEETIQRVLNKARKDVNSIQAKKRTLGVRVIALSNNDLEQKENTDLWIELQQLLQKAKHSNKRHKHYVILHLGNQVNGTKAFQYSKEFMTLEIEKHIGEGELAHSFETQLREKVTDIWRQLYRIHYNYPPIRYIVSHVSNLMIGNDREITDGWGYLPSHNVKHDMITKWVDKGSQDFYVATIARSVYWEYQRSLWDDSINTQIYSVDLDKPIDQVHRPLRMEHEGYLHLFPKPYDLAILFIDQVFGRTFSTEQKSYLTTKQWTEIIDYFSDNGPLHDARMLVIATAIPMLFLDDIKSDIARQIAKSEELRDHWAHGSYRIELIKLLQLIDQWQQKDKNRKVLVLAGELSIGGYSTLYRQVNNDKELVLQQIITSPITASIPKWVAFHLIRKICETEAELESKPSHHESRITLDSIEPVKYVTKHYEWCKERNICIADIKIPSIHSAEYSKGVQFKANIIKATPLIENKDVLAKYDSQALIKVHHSSIVMKQIHEQFGQRSARAGVTMNQFQKMDFNMDSTRTAVEDGTVTARYNFDTASSWNTPLKKNNFQRTHGNVLLVLRRRVQILVIILNLVN